MTQVLQPVKVNRAFAAAAVDEFLLKPEWQDVINKYGWQIVRKDDLTLLVGLRARYLGIGAQLGEFFLIRLTCDYYPTYPPDVQFVNPETGDYVAGLDKHHLPILQAQYCYVHSNFTSYQPNYPYGPQLVCSSITLGYYFSGHAPTPDQLWQPGKHDLGSTIWTIQRALLSEQYKGRESL